VGEGVGEGVGVAGGVAVGGRIAAGSATGVPADALLVESAMPPARLRAMAIRMATTT
jgi:hypothetical protein